MTQITAAQITNPAALQVILHDIFNDVTEIRASIVRVTTGLDADGGITATNFGDNDPAAMLTTIPGAAQGGNPTSDPAIK